MAKNYSSGTITKSAITADTDDVGINVRGYSKIAIHTVFATCTGQASNVGTLNLETSNDKSDWISLLVIKAEDDNSGFDSDSYFDYLPDGTVSGSSGFGKYIRFTFSASNYTGGSVSYTVIYELKA